MVNETETNFTENSSSDCWIEGLDINNPKSTARQKLIIYAMVHNYIVFVLGTLGNAVALWCIGSCKKMTSPAKVLLGNVFLPQFLICLISRPIVAESLRSKLSCGRYSWSREMMVFTNFIYSSWAVIGLICIAVVSIVRVRAVLSTQHQQMRLCVAIVITTVIWLYAFASTAVQIGARLWNWVSDKSSEMIVLYLFFSFNVFLPVIITLICYTIMIISIQRNKRRLAVHSLKTNKVFDPATQAMLAVFVSNLIMSFPHGVFHLLPDPSYPLYVIFHVLYSTHFIIDPAVFIWFNRDYRMKLLCSFWPDSRKKKNYTPSSTNTTNDISLSSFPKTEPMLQETEA